VSLELNPLQRDIIASIRAEDRIVAARCGWGAGKTSALVFAILFISKWRAGTSTLLVTDTNGRYNSVLMPEMEKWLGPLGWTYNHTLRQWCDPSTGSTVWCRSYFRPGTRDTTHNPLEGLNITSGCCLIDECQTLEEEVSHKALGRLRSGPSPIMILVGLPVADAWWCQLAEEAGAAPKLYTSYVNQDNLSDEWFEATKLLPEAEREAMVMNKPKPPSGLVYSEFDPSTMVIDGWEYKPTMSARIAIDWGFRKPSVLILAHDEELNADVICAEFNPAEVTVKQLAQLILSVAWPRALQSSALGDRIWLDNGAADKAGKARNDQTGASAFRAMRAAPPNGLGMPLRSTTDAIRTDILNGVGKLKRAFTRRQYLITREVWAKGERVSGNSIRKALLSYAWERNKEQPKKDGREDPLDALRYDCIMWRWADDQTVDQRRYQGRSKTKSRRVRVGGSKTRSF
jgi:hypothetical protein